MSVRIWIASGSESSARGDRRYRAYSYLILTGDSDILAALFEKVIIPSMVFEELGRAEAPAAVRNWIQSPPGWLEVLTQPEGALDDPSLEGLDEGEKAALSLASLVAADLVLMDDRAGVRAARTRGFRVIGTLRVLDLAARRGFLDLADAFERIKRTNFRYRQEIMDELLDQWKRGT